MADLKPTPARLDLLRAVEAGRVKHWVANLDIYRAWDGWDIPSHGEVKVTARIGEALTAGWIERRPVLGKRYQSYELTDAGRAVLAADTPKEK